MSALPASDAGQVGVLRILTLGFVATAVVMLVVLLTLSGRWDAPDDDLARLGAWIAGLAGLLGLVVAVVWRNRVMAAPVAPSRLLTSWITAVAFAEAGMLVGLVFSMLSQTLTPFVLGAVIFGVSLVVLTTALGQVDLEA